MVGPPVSQTSRAWPAAPASWSLCPRGATSSASSSRLKRNPRRWLTEPAESAAGDLGMATDRDPYSSDHKYRPSWPLVPSAGAHNRRSTPSSTLAASWEKSDPPPSNSWLGGRSNTRGAFQSCVGILGNLGGHQFCWGRCGASAIARRSSAPPQIRVRSWARITFTSTSVKIPPLILHLPQICVGSFCDDFGDLRDPSGVHRGALLAVVAAPPLLGRLEVEGAHGS
jgi:hypothetical protein